MSTNPVELVSQSPCMRILTGDFSRYSDCFVFWFSILGLSCAEYLLNNKTEDGPSGTGW